MGARPPRGRRHDSRGGSRHRPAYSSRELPGGALGRVPHLDPESDEVLSDGVGLVPAFLGPGPGPQVEEGLDEGRDQGVGVGPPPPPPPPPPPAPGPQPPPRPLPP